MTVGDLLSRMSSSEFTEWMIFFKIEAAEAEQSRQGGGNLA